MIPIFACSTHLTGTNGDKADDSAENDAREQNRAEQVKEIAKIVSPAVRSGRAVFVGGDLNADPKDYVLDPLWDKRYGGGSSGQFVEVDSGPSQQRGRRFNRDPRGGDTSPQFSKLGRTWIGRKIDYIFVRGVIVMWGELGKSKVSDHYPLWARVYDSANE